MLKRKTQQLACSDAIQHIAPIGSREEAEIPSNDRVAALINRDIGEKNKYFLITLAEDNFMRMYALDKLYILVDADFVFCFFENGTSQLMRRRSSAKYISVITTERKFLVSQTKGDKTACRVHTYARENNDNTDVLDYEMVEKFRNRYSADPAANSEEPDDVKLSEASAALQSTAKDKAQKKVSRRAPAGCRR